MRTWCSVPHLPADQFEDARLACIQEIRALEDDLAQRAMQELRRRRYGDPFGRNSQGTLETMQRITLDDLRQFFAAHYRPNGAILSVAGKIDFPRLRDHVGQLFAPWQAAPAATLDEIAGRSSVRAHSARVEPDAHHDWLPERTLWARGLLPGAGGRGGAERRHEFSTVHRGA